MEVAAGVHQLHMLGADTFVIAEERLTLIDAGMVGSRRILERQLRGMGRSLAELERIICTHGHPDHIGGVNELVRGRDDLVAARVACGIAESTAPPRPSERAQPLSPAALH